MAATAHAFDIQGHRGARGLMPENTLPAFTRALELGVTTLELDCGITRDGVVVVSHDPALNPDLTRDEAGRWLEAAGPAIAALSYDELQRYDVGRLKPGSEYARRFPRQQAVDGTRIPRLADAFALTRGLRNDAVRFNIETKISPLRPEETAAPDVFVRALLQVIRDTNMERRVTIQSFDWRTLQIVQKNAPEIPTVYLSAERVSPNNIQGEAASSPWTAGLHLSQFDGSVPRMVNAAGGRTWSPYHGDLSADALREAHALGLTVVAWTVNNETDMRRLVAWGVDGLISDYPDLLRRVIDGALPPSAH
ncbi:MAG TPA: glycerophosphodiester phosphodiesterase [Burkholderiales bacterium]|nr:glycerophosphodiester phosphodiesterase [Burkholderiales bacterium]